MKTTVELAGYLRREDEKLEAAQVRRIIAAPGRKVSKLRTYPFANGTINDIAISLIVQTPVILCLRKLLAL